MADTQMGKLLKDVELIKQAQHKLNEAEALAKGITFLDLEEAREQLQNHLTSKYQEIGRLTCETK